MFELPTQCWSIVLEIANVLGIIQMNQDDHDTDQEFSNDASEDAGESTLSSDIKEDDLDNQHEFLHQDQARRDKTIQSTPVPLPKILSHADTVIARTSLPNLWHRAGAIAPPLLKRQESTINIICKLDVVPAQALPLPKAGGDQNVAHP